MSVIQIFIVMEMMKVMYVFKWSYMSYGLDLVDGLIWGKSDFLIMLFCYEYVVKLIGNW